MRDLWLLALWSHGSRNMCYTQANYEQLDCIYFCMTGTIHVCVLISSLVPRLHGHKTTILPHVLTYKVSLNTPALSLYLCWCYLLLSWSTWIWTACLARKTFYGYVPRNLRICTISRLHHAFSESWDWVPILRLCSQYIIITCAQSQDHVICMRNLYLWTLIL